VSCLLLIKFCLLSLNEMSLSSKYKGKSITKLQMDIEI
jgi:hypothetical protein